VPFRRALGVREILESGGLALRPACSLQSHFSERIFPVSAIPASEIGLPKLDF
jgi:hypothetical protein